jgi:hypothetical protein
MSGVQQQHIPAIVETIAHLIGGAIGCLIVIGGLLGVLHLGSHFGTFLAHFAPLRWLWLTLGDLLHALWLFIAMLWLALGDLLHALWLFIAMLLSMMMAAVNVLWWLYSYAYSFGPFMFPLISMLLLLISMLLFVFVVVLVERFQRAGPAQVIRSPCMRACALVHVCACVRLLLACSE